MALSKITPQACRRTARRHGWTVHGASDGSEVIFAKSGRIFLAAFGPSAHSRKAHARLRAAGVSVYRPDDADEWAAIVAYEDRVAGHA